MVARNEFNYFDNMRVERKLPPFLSQGEAADLLDSIVANPILVQLQTLLDGGTRKYEAEFLAVRDRALLETVYSCGLREMEAVGEVSAAF